MAKAKFASLTAGLLARKGEAVPAAHSFSVMNGLARAPQALEEDDALGHLSEGPLSAGPLSDSVAEDFDQSELIDLLTKAARDLAVEAEEAGADEPGDDAHPRPVEVQTLAPAPAPSVAPSVTPVEWPRPAVAPAPEPMARGAFHSGPIGRLRLATTLRRPRTAVTVRLEEPRYLRLKLTAARLHRTSQDILTKALDAYLTALGIEDVTDTRAAADQAGRAARRMD